MFASAPTSATIGPYEIIRPLGVGGMAETYLAVRRRSAAFEQRVCLKRILSDHASDPSFVELFLDEVRLLSAMRCANIVQVIDFGEADASYYMALELVDGCDLEGLMRWMALRGIRPPPGVVVWIADQLLRALHYAHSLERDGVPLEVVHRDISPSNILLSRTGEVKLTDFGIAKYASRQHRTQTGFTKGKLAYMSPEQVHGQSLEAGSDLFSLGTVLHELACGVHPFEAPTELRMLNRILAGGAADLRDGAPDLPVEAVQLVDQLLQAEVAKRPRSAREALACLSGARCDHSDQDALGSMVQMYHEERNREPQPPEGAPVSSIRTGNSASAARSNPHVIRAGDTQYLPTGVDPLERSMPETASQLVAYPAPVRPRTWPLWLAAIALSGSVLGISYWAFIRYGEGPNSAMLPGTASAEADPRPQGSEAPASGEATPRQQQAVGAPWESPEPDRFATPPHVRESDRFDSPRGREIAPAAPATRRRKGRGAEPPTQRKVGPGRAQLERPTPALPEETHAAPRQMPHNPLHMQLE